MGANSSHGPILSKTVYDKENNGLRIGVCEMQGWRRTMEDASIAVSQFGPDNTSLFGIFDGHGGGIVSKFVATNLKNVLVNHPSFKTKKYEQALIESFLKFDEFLKNKEVNEFLVKEQNCINETVKINTETKSPLLENRNQNSIVLKYQGDCIEINESESSNNNNNENNYNSTSADGDELNNTDQSEYYPYSEKDDSNYQIAREMGTTANVVLLTKNHIYISNVGDSLSVMFKNGKAVKLNQEHKTTLRSEYERIQKSGGHIYNNRIEGKLNLTRAIGDLIFKSQPGLKFYEQSVTAFPEITKIKRTDDISFIVMACDGVWDCVEEQGFCEEIEKNIRMNPRKKLSDIIAEIFDKLVSKTNNIPIGTDNMSCIIVQFVNSNDKYINNSNEIKRSVVED